MSQKGSVNTILIIAVVVLLGVTVYLAQDRVFYRSVKDKTPSKTIQEEDKAKSEGQTIKQAAELKTYENRELGVYFQYPRNWMLVYDESGYYSAACKGNTNDANCKKAVQVGLGRVQNKPLLEINKRQCLNVQKLAGGDTLCYDAALGDKRGITYSENGERANLLDKEVNDVVVIILDSFYKK